MRDAELPILVEWAATEQWNPGFTDVEVAWRFDPDAFIAVRERGELIAGGSVISYGAAFGFMGLFIVRSDRRGAGLGRRLWYCRRDLLVSRLRPGVSIGMDGVFNMVPFYERGGFRLAYRDLRFEGVAHGARHGSVVDLASVAFEAVDAFDRRHVAAPRTSFLRAWIDQPGVIAGAVVEDGRLAGYGVLRPCRIGYKFGPVFAERDDIARRLVEDLMARVDGQQVQLDVPEPNAQALAIAERHGLRESFGCARMYLGPDPLLPVERIFGVTSFEFG